MEFDNLAITPEHKKSLVVLRKELAGLVINSVSKNILDEKFGILFSGGIDSSLIALICKQLEVDFTCYCVGYQEKKSKMPEDIVYAKKVAKHFGFKLKYKLYNLKEVEKAISELKKILGTYTNVVNIGVGLVEYFSLELSKEKRLFSGLGSEEIFAGYERHKVKDINKECLNGLKGIYERDIVRDTKISKHFKIKFLTPFLDKDLVEYSLKIPAKYKLNKNNNKIILRLVAKDLGLGIFSERKKRAAQYGSRFDKALYKLARLNGFKFKKDYLK